MTDPRIRIIQEAVAEVFGTQVRDMQSARRALVVARPRQVAMYLCKRLTAHSLPKIGQEFGNRDHTTIMHAVKRIEALMEGDLGLRDKVLSLVEQLSNGALDIKPPLEQTIEDIVSDLRKHLLRRAREDPVKFVRDLARL